MKKLLATMILFTGIIAGNPLQEEIKKLPPPPLEGISRTEEQDLRIDFDIIQAGQNIRYLPKGIENYFGNPAQLPDFNTQLAEAVFSSRNRLTELFHYGYRLLGAAAGGYGPPLPDVTDPALKHFNELPIPRKLDALKQKMGLEFSYRDFDQWQILGPEIQDALLNLFYEYDQSSRIMLQFAGKFRSRMAEADPGFEENFQARIAAPWENRQLANFSTIDNLHTIDLAKLALAHRRMNEAAENLINLRPAAIPEIGQCLIHSKWGDIYLNGKADQSIQDYALSVDFGGDDQYSGTNPGNLSEHRWIRAIIDFDGSDQYGGTEQQIGSAVLALDLIYDLRGDDTYSSDNNGIASALLGASAIYDAEGNDTYSCTADFSIAAARFGVACIADMAGDDRYLSRAFSQGFASTMGSGLLLDFSGNDYYGGTDGNRYSFMQGTSRGRWAQATDGHNLGGGFGALLDFAGDDQYSAKSFSQAASYYAGLGILHDAAGDDQYDAVSHSQGYAVHYALAVFVENQGADLYNSLVEGNQLTQIIGGGRDMSSGWLIDHRGNDTYHFGNRSAGVGDFNGIGVLKDLNGDDTYIHHHNDIYRDSTSLGTEFGGGSEMRIDHRIFQTNPVLNIGCFIDSSGGNRFVTVEE